MCWCSHRLLLANWLIISAASRSSASLLWLGNEEAICDSSKSISSRADLRARDGKLASSEGPNSAESGRFWEVRGGSWTDFSFSRSCGSTMGGDVEA